MVRTGFSLYSPSGGHLHAILAHMFQRVLSPELHCMCNMASLYSPSRHGLGYYGGHGFYLNSAIEVGSSTGTSDPNDLEPWHEIAVFYLAQTSHSLLP